MTWQRHVEGTLAGACILVLAAAAVHSEEVRSRTLLDSGHEHVAGPDPRPQPGRCPLRPEARCRCTCLFDFAFDSDRLSDTARRNLAVISEVMLAPELRGRGLHC